MAAPIVVNGAALEPGAPSPLFQTHALEAAPTRISESSTMSPAMAAS